MGMAASQARFLGLTARKTNVEYEGQQINQQRTALGNQSANYYNQMLGMSVPKPPSVNDFTKTVYSFEDGSLKNTITSLIAKAGGEYTVSYLREWQDDFSVIAGTSNLVTKASEMSAADATIYTTFTSANGAGGCYSAAKTYSPNNNNDEIASHTVHVLNHMLPGGTYLTSGGQVLEVFDDPTFASTDRSPAPGHDAWDSHYWTDNSSESATLMNTIATRIAGKDIVQDIVDLLYDARTAGKSGMDLNQNNPGALALRTSIQQRLLQICETDLKNSLSSTEYYVGADRLRALGTVPTQEQIDSDEYLSTLTAEQIDKLIAEEMLYSAKLQGKYGSDIYMVRYVQNTSTGKWEPNFYKKSDLQKTTYDDYTNISHSKIQYYAIGSEKKTDEAKGINARLEQDATGRIINITMNPGDANEVKYALTTNTITDQAAYDDAMNQYEFDKYQYDQTIQEVNAKIAIIQAEDKNLELRLKQLDTEQNAISTEMDAVSKVIEKNVESTFKTFG
ncbi:MAG: hypothetical protein LBK53_04695 [Heliobacteriaceae bacterium]|jgi:hypothetical protein|nr:hypothetical protein [Heliobacteriaceae bacterium]